MSRPDSLYIGHAFVGPALRYPGIAIHRVGDFPSLSTRLWNPPRTQEVLGDLHAWLDQTRFRFSPPQAVRKDLRCFFLEKQFCVLHSAAGESLL